MPSQPVRLCQGARETEGQRQTEAEADRGDRETETGTETARQTDRQTDGQTIRGRQRQRDRNRNRDKEREGAISSPVRSLAHLISSFTTLGVGARPGGSLLGLGTGR